MSQSNAVRDTYTKTPAAELEALSPSLASGHLKYVSAISVLNSSVTGLCLSLLMLNPVIIRPVMTSPHPFFFSSPSMLTPSELRCITSLLSLRRCAVRFRVVSSLIHMCSSSPGGRPSNIAVGIHIYVLHAVEGVVGGGGGGITTITAPPA